MPKPRLGQRVVFHHVLSRKRDRNGKVTWQKTPCGNKVGYLVGLRTVKEGYITTESEWDEWSYSSASWRVFNQTGVVRAALVVTNIYQNPIHIPREELE